MNNTTSHAARGFTLVELLITLVIASILMAIAVPSYRRHIIRSHRTDAMNAILRIQAAQEKFFLQHNAYALDLAAMPPAGLALSKTSDNGFYDLMLEATDVEFTVTATPRKGTGQVADKLCQIYEADHTGVKRAKDSGGVDRTHECWR